MFERNERYCLIKVELCSEYDIKIDEFNELLVNAIGLMEESVRDEHLKKIIDFSKISEQELDEYKLKEKITDFSKISEKDVKEYKLKEKVYISRILNSFSLKIKDDIKNLILDKMFEIFDNVTAILVKNREQNNLIALDININDFKKNISGKLSQKLSEVYISAYDSIQFENENIKQIIKKFSKTQRYSTKDFDLKSENIDFTGIKLSDIIGSIEDPNELIVKEEIFKNIVNITKLELEIESGSKHLSLIENDTYYGYLIGEYFFPFEYTSFRSKINTTSQALYDFKYLKINLDKTMPSERKMSHIRKQIKTSFMESFNKPGSNLPKNLSELENNYYLEDINSECSELFNKSLLIKKLLKDKDDDLIDLKHYHFIVSGHNVSTGTDPFFGIYNDDKSRNHDDESKRGLKSWIDFNGKTLNYNQKVLQKDEIKEILHLDPQFSFYYQNHFFEDLLNDIFDELKKDGHIQDFIHSVKLGDPEFDFIVLYENKIYVFEAKTKLNGHYIQKQLKKFNDLHTISNKYYKNGIKRNLLDNYVIVGFNCDEKDLRDKFMHFIPDDECNKDKSYSFEVPMNGHPGLNLKCISDIKIDALKTKISSSIVS